MIIETVFVAGMAFAIQNRRSSDCSLEYDTAVARNGFQIASGCSKERQIMREVEDINGVSEVSVNTTEAGLDINVILETFDFESFDRVIQKELELSDRYPNLTINVNVESLSASERCSLANAA